MKIISEMSFSDFEPWSGACDTYNRICDENKQSEMDYYLEEMFPDGCTDTELNDLLWFDSEMIYEYLGILENDEEEILSEIGKEYMVISSYVDFPFGSIVVALEDEDTEPYCVLKEIYEKEESLNPSNYEDEDLFAIEMEDLEEI